MKPYISVRNSMDRRSCIACNSPHGDREIKISNVTIYLCRGCKNFLYRALGEED